VHGVGLLTGGQGFVWQRRARGVDGAGTDQMILERELVAVLFGYGPEHFDSLGGDLHADAVTG
jgi:hypothetical protein